MSLKFNNVPYQCNRLEEKSEVNEKINVKSLRKGMELGKLQITQPVQIR